MVKNKRTKSAQVAFTVPAGLVKHVMEWTQGRGVLGLQEVLEGQGVDHHGHERHVGLFAVLLRVSKVGKAASKPRITTTGEKKGEKENPVHTYTHT